MLLIMVGLHLLQNLCLYYYNLFKVMLVIWGWTIVILTILIKLVLYPLSYKGMVSMQKLKDLAPKWKKDSS